MKIASYFQNRYAHWLYIYAGAFAAFQVEGCVRGSALPAFAQIGLVFAALSGFPFLARWAAGEILFNIKSKRAFK